jgi:hypothetical protein
MALIWVKRKGEYFFEPDWTGQISLIRLDKFAVARKRRRPDAATGSGEGRIRWLGREDEGASVDL